MVRSRRVLSFMSEWGGNNTLHKRTTSSASVSPAPASPSFKQQPTTAKNTNTNLPDPPNPNPQFTSSTSSAAPLDNQDYQSPSQTPNARARSDSRASSRPVSMIQTYQPPVMDVSQDTLPELQRIFTFLNSHSNKLYQEGYFLKFHDTDSRGRPAPDRVWQECFAQLVGTILSLWDASELDKVGGDTEVLPTFINLTDAAIHMMPSMVLGDGKKLDNILSVSTAASNKYLFHFNSFNSLTQWTAGIRLAMYEHTTLQEAYTGALIAGKGKQLNNIRAILDRVRPKHEEWVRVRFGAGTPWRRCWCVVSPPDEKELAKLQKSQKKQSLYSRSPAILKGDIKFYDAKKINKKTRPIATVKDCYSCYAIYPQSKPLIDQSTLVKMEGKITIHSVPESVTEGFVFVMPESHPAVSGFEILLRFLFPVFDTFALYGRPNKLIADVLDTRGLMFAMPSDRRYGYLEMWDVVSLIHTEGSQTWSERQWRKALKDLTSTRMLTSPSRGTSIAGSRRNTVSRAGTRNSSIRFEERGSIRSQPSTRQSSPSRNVEFDSPSPRRVDSAPPTSAFATPRHQRSVSEANGYKQYQADTPSRLANAIDYDTPPAPPKHRHLNGTSQGTPQHSSEDILSDGESPGPEVRDLPEVQARPTEPPRGPVASPPTFAHGPSQRPPYQPYHPPTAMKPNTQMDPATLHQLADATHTPLPAGTAAAGAVAAWRSQENLANRRSGEYAKDGPQMHLNGDARSFAADQYQQNMNGSRSGHSGTRLPTIPASPYMEQPEFVDSPTATFQPSAPPVPEDAELPNVSPAAELPSSQPAVERPSSQPAVELPSSQPAVELPSSQPVELPPAQTQGDVVHRPPPGGGHGSQSSIHRKPVPGRSSYSSEEKPDNRSTRSSSLGSLRNDIIDPEALDRLNAAEAALARMSSQSSSRYDDDSASTTTPDYASTCSEEPRPRKLPERGERPRSGMLKVIGNPDLNAKSDLVVGDAHYDPSSKPIETSSDIPTIDFGPTYVLAPDTKRPSTSGTMTQLLHDNGFSQSRENLAHSPNEKRVDSYVSGRTTPNAPFHMRSSSTSPQFDDTRTIAWQPGMTSHARTRSENKKLDPEDWVAQRAARPFTPQMPPSQLHIRSKSHTPPPLGRTHSGDWTHLQRTPEAMPMRPPSRPLSRPLSRGPGLLLDQKPTTLSAREQETVARLTGTPLIDLKHNTKKTQKPSADGLTAYIDRREKDKAKAKTRTNHNTPAMQAEIDRRTMAAQQRQMLEMRELEQQMMEQQMMEQQMLEQQMMNQQQQLSMAQNGYGTPSVMGAPQSFPRPQSQVFTYGSPVPMQHMYQQPQQQQSGYFSQSVMPQGMQMSSGWGTPSPQSVGGAYFQQGGQGVAMMQQQQQIQQQLQQQQQQLQMQQQQPVTQRYGASFDQAQAAARFAHTHRRG